MSEIRDVSSQVQAVYTEGGTSKSGKQYTLLKVAFKNGYTYQTFLNNDQQMILRLMPAKDSN